MTYQNFLYSIQLLADSGIFEQTSVFCFVYDEIEPRSLEAINYIRDYHYHLDVLIIFIYPESTLVDDDVQKQFGEVADDIIIINVNHRVQEFMSKLRSVDSGIWGHNLVLDISCLKIPELFVLIKFLKIHSGLSLLSIIYSIPSEYYFSDEPFTSFKFSGGDLSVLELPGYTGESDINYLDDLIIFIGFEGSLSLKVVEDRDYGNLTLVNSMPAFYQKYKDIVAINNHAVMSKKNCNMIYAPADNPYVTYNILDDFVKKNGTNKNIGVAPLSTKLSALGVCLFALEHNSVKIIYPIANQYLPSSKKDVYQSYVFSTRCFQRDTLLK